MASSQASFPQRYRTIVRHAGLMEARQTTASAVGFTAPLLRRIKADQSLGIGTRTWLVDRKYAALADPRLGAVVHILGLGLEHETLTRTKAAYIDQCPVPFWKLIGMIWCVRLVHYIDVGLCATQGSEIAADAAIST
jgi:hypothetical protein